MAELLLSGISLLFILVVAPVAIKQLRRGYYPLAIGLLFLAYQLITISIAATATASLQIFFTLIGVTFFLLPNINVPNLSLTSPDVLKRTWVLSCFWVGFTAFVLLIFAHGIPVFSDSPNEARVDFFSNGYLSTLFVAPFQALLFGLSISLMGGYVGSRLASPILFIVCLSFLATGNRGLLLFPLFGVGLYAMFRYRRGFQVTLVSGLTLVVASAIYSSWRNYTTWGYDHLENLARQGYTGWRAVFASDLSYLSGTSEAFDLIIQTFPESTAHPKGSIFFNALIAPLPGEQITAGAFLKSSLGYDFDGFGLAMGAFGGFYMDFGLFGIVAGMTICGLIVRWLYSHATVNRRFLLPYFYFGGHLILMNYSHPLPNFTFVIVPAILYFAFNANEES